MAALPRIQGAANPRGSPARRPPLVPSAASMGDSRQSFPRDPIRAGPDAGDAGFQAAHGAHDTYPVAAGELRMASEPARILPPGARGQSERQVWQAGFHPVAIVSDEMLQ